MKLVQFIKNFAREDDGVTAIEYGLIAALIAVTIIASVTIVGTQLVAVARDAWTTGMQTSLLVGAVIVLVAAAISFAFLPKRRAAAIETDAELALEIEGFELDIDGAVAR